MTIPIQLALQGGGAKITYLLAALDAVQSLEREGVLRVTRIAGTSAGAIAGALYAAGVDMRRARDAFDAAREELLGAFPRAGAWRWSWMLMRRKPLWNAAPLRTLLRNLLQPRETLGDLDVPLTIVATDLTNMQPCVYSSSDAPLVSSILDSAGIPFFFRTAPANANYRVIVDGGICENLPTEELTYAPEAGEVVGITFALTRAAAPLTTFADFARALFETAMRSPVLRAHLELGPNNFVIRTDAGAFDFERALGSGLGAEYRETRLLAERFFRDYAARRANADRTVHALARDARVRPQLPLEVGAALRTMYRRQHERVKFEILSARLIVTAASSSRAMDDLRHEIVLRASGAPVHCYRIQLTPATAPDLHQTQCEVFACLGQRVAFDLVPVPEAPDDVREYLLFLRSPLVTGDSRAPLTLRVRDAVAGAIKLAAEGRDELLTRATRADRPIPRIEIVVHLPEELSDTTMAPAFGSEGRRMSPAELVPYAAPAGYFTLGWKGENVPPDSLFGCNLVRR